MAWSTPPATGSSAAAGRHAVDAHTPYLILGSRLIVVNAAYGTPRCKTVVNSGLLSVPNVPFGGCILASRRRPRKANTLQAMEVPWSPSQMPVGERGHKSGCHDLESTPPRLKAGACSSPARVAARGRVTAAHCFRLMVSAAFAFASAFAGLPHRWQR